MIHRYIWSGLALLPTMVRGGIGDLNGIGWGRGILLAVLGGPVFAILGYAGFLLVPLGHGGVIQPSSGTLGGLFLATLVLRERLIPSRLVGADHCLRAGCNSASACGLRWFFGSTSCLLSGRTLRKLFC